MNLIKLWIYRGFNHYYASIGAVMANDYGRLVREAIKTDAELRERLHTAADGKWYGFGFGPHIGFKNWNSEEAANPIIEEVIPVPGAGLIAGLVGETGATSGEFITVEVDKTKIADGEDSLGFTLVYKDGRIEFAVEPRIISKAVIDEIKSTKDEILENYPQNTCVEERGIAVLDAAHYFNESHSGSKEFKVVSELGRCENAVKLFDTDRPVDYSHRAKGNALVGYEFYIQNPGDYEITFRLLPTHAYEFGKEIKLSYSVNGEDGTVIYYKTEDLKNGTWNSWSDGVMSHVRDIKDTITLEQGKNNITFFGDSEENILEKIILVKKGVSLLPSYLGPEESVVL